MDNMIRDAFNAVAPTVKEMLLSYGQKPRNVDNETWLNQTLSARMSQEEADHVTNEITSTIDRFSANMANLRQARAAGLTNEDWLRGVVESNDTMTDEQKGEYILEAGAAFGAGNRIMMDATHSEAPINITDEINRLNANSAQFENPSTVEWDRMSLMKASDHLVQQTELMTVNGVSSGFATGIDLGKGQPVACPQDVINAELAGTIDQGVKMIAASALQEGIMSGKIPFLSKAMPIGAITNIACVGVEGVKSIGRFATGKISASEALDQIKAASVAALADFFATGVPAKFLAPIPVIGPALSFAVGGYLSTLSNEQLQILLYNGLNTLQEIAEETAEAMWATLETVGETVENAFTSVKEFLFG